MLLLLTSFLAQADIPPPRDYVESCTVEKVQTEGLRCQACDGWHGGREACETLEAQGYTAKCRTSGASVWKEVLCRAADAPEAGDPVPAATDDPAEPSAGTPVIEPAVGDPATNDPVVTPAPIDPADSSKCSHVPGTALPWALLLPLALLRRRV